MLHVVPGIVLVFFLSFIVKVYLSQEKELNSEDKKNLLSAMNRCERIIIPFGEVGRGFMKLNALYLLLDIRNHF